MSSPRAREGDLSDTPLRPRVLSAGARVALVAPAGPLDPERIGIAVERCRHLDLEPVVFPCAGERTGYLAGSDEQRLGDLQDAFDDPSIDAVWALRGGYGTMRILDGLDLSRQARDPIPFIGFSDNTTIHVRHAAAGVVSFHGPHAAGPFPPETESWFRSVLFTPEPPGALPVPSTGPEPRALVGGVAEGRLIGGNLAMLAALCGSADVVSARDRILVLEDVGEPAYRLDRMLVQLHRAGALEGVRGLAFGRFTDGTDTEAEAAVLEEIAGLLGVPAVAELPFGHVDHNCVVPVGAMARLDGEAATLDVVEAAVSPD